MAHPFDVLHALAAQDEIADQANGIANILDRGGVGVAALAIIALGIVFWLYVRQTKKVMEIVEKTTGLFSDVTNELNNVVKGLDQRDEKAKEIKTAVDEVKKLIFERLPPRGS